MPRKIYIVGLYNSPKHYINWMQGKLADTMEEADLVVFTGGEDVSPYLYNEPVHDSTFNNPTRDEFELRMFKKAKELNKPMLGICRGAQFLCVMAGGKLVQHQQNPTFTHWLHTDDEKLILTSSTHHQAQYPWGLSKEKFRLIAWALGQSHFHLGGNNEELVNDKVEDEKEVEIAFYPEIKALCIQGHPEMMYSYIARYPEVHKSITYFRRLLAKFLNNKL